MRTIKRGNIVINVNSDFSGTAHITIGGEGQPRSGDVDGRKLLQGDVGTTGTLQSSDITRAVSMAVEDYMFQRAIGLVESLGLPRER